MQYTQIIKQRTFLPAKNAKSKRMKVKCRMASPDILHSLMQSGLVFFFLFFDYKTGLAQPNTRRSDTGAR